MHRKAALLYELFLTFLKVGLFTFGGGYAMISVISHACVEQKQWLTHDEMMNVTVVAESTPGPIAINCATYTGFKMAGMAGAVIATLGMVLPSFVIIYLISRFLEHLMEIALIAKAFQGLKIGVGVLIVDVGLTMLRKMPKKPQPRMIFGCAFLIMLVCTLCSVHLSSIVLMLAAGAVSLALFMVRSKTVSKGGDAR